MEKILSLRIAIRRGLGALGQEDKARFAKASCN
jgi:hypothetical protein